MSDRRSRRRRTAPAMVAGALVAALVPGAQAAGAVMSTPATASGGQLTLIASQDGQPTMDPALSLIHSVVNSVWLSAVYDLLVYIDPATGDVVTYLAEGLEPNDDGSVWTMRLRPDVNFSDGTPFDAAAVHAEMQRLADPDTTAASRDQAQAVETTVVDDLTIEFRPDEPDLNYAHIIALNFALIPSPTAIAADPDGFGQRPVGAGPFVLTEWVVGERKTFERNPDYWQDGLPHLDGWESIVVNDHQQQINRMQAGDAQVISNQTAELFQMGRDAGFEVVTGGQLSGGFIWSFNHRIAPFDDVRARRAFQLIVDNQAMNDLLFPAGGVATPTNLLSVDSPFYDASLDFPPVNRDEAQRLLDEIAADGEPLSFDVTVRSGAEPIAIAEFAQAAFAEYDNVGEIGVAAFEGGEYTARMRGGEYTVGRYTGWWSAPYPVMHQIYQTDGTLNYSGYSNPDVDALFQQARSTTDPAELGEIYGEITTIMTDDVAVVPFQVAEVGFIHTDEIGGIHGVHLGNTPLWAEIYTTESV